MANSRQSATIFSPSSKRPTKRTRSSITEHSFQGIAPSPRGGSVTYVSGTNCHPCVGSLKNLCLRPLKKNRGFLPWLLPSVRTCAQGLAIDLNIVLVHDHRAGIDGCGNRRRGRSVPIYELVYRVVV